ncbi:histone-lysine N-methyltransferase SETDB1-A [Labrus bergylta]|uniref:histone-lysine N-methyltransferase SETDB1-A n=1 Tax=Labrus bergylta TaxID=56723 RepID=UPI0009B4A83B|nr:histone-lysine N-methyltransferase SETDB1-A-like [Labrus bergylta]
MPYLSDYGLEGDEMEMCKEELQKWISARVKKQLLSTGVLEKYNLLLSLLNKREDQATQLLKLCKSVAVCEAIVKKQYSLLGWEYRDIDSEDDNQGDKDDETEGPGNTSPVQGLSSPAAKPLLLNLVDRENSSIRGFVKLKRKPVVVLKKLPYTQIKPLLRPPPQGPSSDVESFSDADSDTHWEPEKDSSDSDCSISSFNSGSKKRRKIERKETHPAKPQESTSTNAKSKVTSAPKASSISNAKDNIKKSSATKTDAKSNTKKDDVEKSSAVKAEAKSNTKEDTAVTSTPAANTKIVTPSSKKSLCQSSVVATNTPVSILQGKLCVNMNVLARKKPTRWLEGKILELIQTDDKLRYKVGFEKGRKIVSGHHIALTSTPNVDELKVGDRVVLKCGDNPSRFIPGILAELPNRKNRMRFLVFADDRTPHYVGLPKFRQVFGQMKDPLDDIPDGVHKDFIKEYMASLPFPVQTSYRVGQTLNAEFEGFLQKCEVVQIDNSLIRVLFQKDQHKEWIYRGSMRLEHIISMKNMRLQKESSKQTD